MTGYELAKRFDNSVGFFWRANHQQIYRELRQLADKNWVLGQTITQEGRPNKTVFSISELGKNELYTWSGYQAELLSFKEEFLLKFYALDRVDISALKLQVMQRTQRHRERLNLYEKILERHYQNESALSQVGKGKLMGLKAGLMTERGWLGWCEEALEMLKTLK